MNRLIAAVSTINRVLTTFIGKRGHQFTFGTCLLLMLPTHVGATSLLDAVRQGFGNHPEVRSAVAKVDRSTTEVDIAKGGYYPALEASAGPANGLAGSLTYNLTATQMLYDWGRVKSQVDSASAALREQMESLLVVREDAALDISEIYLDVLATGQRIEAARGHIERLEELHKLSQQRGEAGYVDRSEQGRVSLELARAREQMAIEQGRLQDARQQYRELIGELPPVLEDPVIEPFSERLAKGAELERVIAASPLYRQAMEKKAVEEAKVREADAALYPQLNLEGSVMRRELGGEMTEDSMLALRIHINTSHGLSNFKRTTAARQRLEAAGWDVNTRQREIRRKVLSLFENESSLKWREQSLDEQITHARDVSSVYQEQFVAGLRNMTELLNIYQDRFEAERQIITLKNERKRAKCRAAAQLGLLIPLIEGRLSEAISPETNTP